VHKQNNVPPEFPLFVRNGFNIKVVADGYATAPSGLIYKVLHSAGPKAHMQVQQCVSQRRSWCSSPFTNHQFCHSGL